MKQVLKLSLALTVVAALAGITIAFGNAKTIEQINTQRSRAQEQALTSLFKEGTTFSQEIISTGRDTLSYWRAYHNDSLQGYVLKTGAQGYSSFIKLLVAVSPSQKIIGITVLSQEETPGLGSRMTEEVAQSTFWTGLFKKQAPTTPWFQAQFRGLILSTPIVIEKKAEWYTQSPEEQKALQKKNSVSSITGATISTQAVCDAVTATLSQLQSLQKIQPKGNEVQ